MKRDFIIIALAVILGFVAGWYCAQTPIANASDAIHCDKPVCEPGENE